MKTIFESWKGAIEINGTRYNQISDLPSDILLNDDMNILLIPQEEVGERQAPQACDKIFKVTVRQYMTKEATPEFDFMQKWNNNIPMPLRTMVGTIEKETPGMYKMNLHADITSKITTCCMKCGKPITNPVSQFFGMGPECGKHNYINPFSSDIELQNAVEIYRKEYLQKITWSGWVIKKAIEQMEVI